MHAAHANARLDQDNQVAAEDKACFVFVFQQDVFTLLNAL